MSRCGAFPAAVKMLVGNVLVQQMQPIAAGHQTRNHQSDPGHRAVRVLRVAAAKMSSAPTVVPIPAAKLTMRAFSTVSMAIMGADMQVSGRRRDVTR